MTRKNIAPEEHFHEVEVTEEAAVHAAVMHALVPCKHI